MEFPLRLTRSSVPLSSSSMDSCWELSIALEQTEETDELVLARTRRSKEVLGNKPRKGPTAPDPADSFFLTAEAKRIFFEDATSRVDHVENLVNEEVGFSLQTEIVPVRRDDRFNNPAEQSLRARRESDERVNIIPESPPQGRTESLSKTLSFALRHRAKDLGLTVDSAGWVAVDAILECSEFAEQEFGSSSGLGRIDVLGEEEELGGVEEGEDEGGKRGGAAAAPPASVDVEENTIPDGGAADEAFVACASRQICNRFFASARSPGTSLEEIKHLVNHQAKSRFQMRINSSSPPPVEQQDLVVESIDETPDSISAAAPHRSPTYSQQPGRWEIRAAQGHTIKSVQTAELLKVVDESLAKICHGTYKILLPTIFESGGLNRMARNHIHFVKGGVEQVVGEDDTVGGKVGAGGAAPPPSGGARPDPPNKPISGFREDSDCVIEVDLVAARAAGYRFFESSNGVILCAGDAGYVVRINMLSRVGTRNSWTLWGTL